MNPRQATHTVLGPGRTQRVKPCPVCPHSVKGTAFLLTLAIWCQPTSAQDATTESHLDTRGSSAKRFKAFLASPPVVKEMIVMRSYATRKKDVPDQYYLIRYQSNAFLFVTADALQPLINPPSTTTNSRVVANATSAFFAAGRYESNWWTVGGVARDVKIWNQSDDTPDVSDPVREALEQQFCLGMELLLLGINDITLTPSLLGMWKWEWIDDTFTLRTQRHWQGRFLETSFSGTIQRDALDRVASMRLDKTFFDAMAEKPRSWSYMFRYLYEPGPRPDYLPARTKKFFCEPDGGYREIDNLTYLTIELASNSLPRDMFMPDGFTTPRSFRFFTEGGNVYYYDEHGRKVRQPTAEEVGDARGVPVTVVFYTVLGLLILFPLFIYLRHRNPSRHLRTNI